MSAISSSPSFLKVCERLHLPHLRRRVRPDLPEQAQVGQDLVERVVQGRPEGAEGANGRQHRVHVHVRVRARVVEAEQRGPEHALGAGPAGPAAAELGEQLGVHARHLELPAQDVTHGVERAVAHPRDQGHVRLPEVLDVVEGAVGEHREVDERGRARVRGHREVEAAVEALRRRACEAPAGVAGLADAVERPEPYVGVGQRPRAAGAADDRERVEEAAAAALAHVEAVGVEAALGGRVVEEAPGRGRERRARARSARGALHQNRSSSTAWPTGTSLTVTLIVAWISASSVSVTLWVPNLSISPESVWILTSCSRSMSSALRIFMSRSRWMR